MSKAEVYRGIVRINEDDRKTSLGETLEESKVMRVRVGNKSILAWARGNQGQAGVIVLDEFQRSRLGVAVGKTYEFALERKPLLGSVRWAFAHPEPIYRVSAWLGVLSVVLGILSIVLSTILTRFAA